MVETIADATVDGTLHPYDLTIDNPVLVSSQTVSIASYNHRAVNVMSATITESVIVAGSWPKEPGRGRDVRERHTWSDGDITDVAYRCRRY